MLPPPRSENACSVRAVLDLQTAESSRSIFTEVLDCYVAEHMLRLHVVGGNLATVDERAQED